MLCLLSSKYSSEYTKAMLAILLLHRSAETAFSRNLRFLQSYFFRYIRRCNVHSADIFNIGTVSVGQGGRIVHLKILSFICFSSITLFDCLAHPLAKQAPCISANSKRQKLSFTIVSAFLLTFAFAICMGGWANDSFTQCMFSKVVFYDL